MSRLGIVVVALGLVANYGFADGTVRLPSAEERAKATRLIRELFKEEYARTGMASQAELAGKLIQQAADTRDDPAAQYSLYRETAELAAAGNIDLALEACDAVVKRFEGPSEQVVEPILEAVIAKATKPEAFGQVAGFAMRRVDAALADDDIDTARRRHKVAESAAERAKSLRIVKQVQGQAGEIEAFRRTQEAVARARETLKSKPDDADAALVLGKHLSFLKGDWAKGLPLLAKSSDAKLKQLATKDLDTNHASAMAMQPGPSSSLPSRGVCKETIFGRYPNDNQIVIERGVAEVVGGTRRFEGATGGGVFSLVGDLDDSGTAGFLQFNMEVIVTLPERGR